MSAQPDMEEELEYVERGLAVLAHLDDAIAKATYPPAPTFVEDYAVERLREALSSFDEALGQATFLKTIKPFSRLDDCRLAIGAWLVEQLTDCREAVEASLGTVTYFCPDPDGDGIIAVTEESGADDPEASA